MNGSTLHMVLNEQDSVIEFRIQRSDGTGEHIIATIAAVLPDPDAE